MQANLGTNVPTIVNAARAACGPLGCGDSHCAGSNSRGTVITGGVGSGKTAAMRTLAKSLIESGHKVFALDPVSQLASGLAGEHVVQLNPLRQDSMQWDFWKEITDTKDIQAMAEALLIHDPVDTAWSHQACILLRGLLELGTNLDDLRHMLALSTESLIRLLSSTSVASEVHVANGRAVAVTVEHLRTRLQVLLYTRYGASSFSLTDWLRDPNDRRVVLLSCDSAQLPAVRGFMAMLTDVVIRRVQASEDRGAGVALLLEDLPTLVHPIPSLRGLVTDYDSTDASWAISCQHTSQLVSTYGPDFSLALDLHAEGHGPRV